MIRIHRPPLDPKLGERLAVASAKAADFFQREGRRQQRHEFDTRFWREARIQLTEAQHGKCAYCESAIEAAGQANLELFRPRAGARQLDKSPPFPDCYWWLASEWTNMLASCQACNTAKLQFFPIEGERALDPSMPLTKEKPLLIDPASEEPARDLRFDRDGLAQGVTKRGEATIGVLRLNRPALVKARADAIRQAASLDEIPDSMPYAGAIRSARATPLVRGKSTKRAAPRAPSAAPVLPGAFDYVHKVEIRNFRAIADLSLTFETSADRGVDWKVFLGENSTGKSTILKAVALVLMGSGHLDSVRSYLNGVRRRYQKGGRTVETASGFVRVTFLGGTTSAIEFDRKGVRFTAGGNGVAGTIRGYGAMRLLPESGLDAVPRSRADVSNLFQPRQSLVNANQWMISLHEEDIDKFHQFATQIKYLLRLDPEREIEVRDGHVWFPLHDAPTRLDEMSDGFQSMVALAVDLMSSFTGLHTMETEPGILLLDELGTHLHPRWRMEFVERLRSTFQGLQVIATTHEPLCLRGLQKGEVALLRRDGAGRLELVGDELPNIEGMRADQILTSPLFGLESTIDAGVEAKFVRYYDLLARATLTPDEEQQKQDLAAELKPHRHLAYTRRDQMMYEVIDQYLAKERTIPHHRRKVLKQTTMKQLRSIWEELNVPGV